ncbi:putative MFS family arabinose efflux permease [Mucilaginibacter yixingensis]|uniref:Putative MFS family arabinose efflux permease n=1 Tax=Mucilaginibacter yixingensis TaxID=1295612 RepID=A0A2T5JBI9_9SPHI|nr:MFS transporter [Mucilaginibacter yixingensis]PTQ98238.1 putative MFS family arabinose efflux permease [Mucilaginibacter yixingensis]
MNSTAVLSAKPIKEHHQGIATILAFALLPLSGFATDIYIPSLPSMAGQLQVSNIQVQMTLTLFLISYGVTQLFIGSLLDSFGRYHIALWSLILFAAASFVIALTHNIWVIYLMRIVHGITVGGVIVAKRAYFIDLFSGEKLKGYLSMFSIIWSTGPIVAPFIGGYLETAFGWKSNFYFLGGFAAVLALLDYVYSGETLQNISAFKLKSIAKTYATMFSTVSFTIGLIMIGLAYSMVMIYNMTGPFIIEHKFHQSPVVAGYSSLILGLAWMTGGIIGKATINKPFMGRMAVNITIQVVLSILMLITIRYVSGIAVMILFAFLIHVAAGFTFNNFFTYCLSLFPKNGGVASGLSGGVNYVIVSVMSYSIVAALPAKDATNLGWSYLLLIIASVLAMFVLKLKKA